MSNRDLKPRFQPLRGSCFFNRAAGLVLRVVVVFFFFSVLSVS